MSFALLRRAVLSALVLVSLLIALAIPAAPARAAGAGMIHGKVVDSVTLLPIQDVCVYLGIPGNFCLWKTAADRSEERRVGKECRARGGVGHEKKNKEHTEATS